MSVRIETTDRVDVGDQIELEGVPHVVVEAAIWTDAADNYAYTVAYLAAAGGDDGEDPRSD